MFLNRFSELRFSQIDVKLEFLSDELKEIKLALNLLLLAEAGRSTSALIQREELKNMTAELQALTDQVKANTDVEASGVLLIKGLADKIAALAVAGDTAGIVALTEQLKASAAPLLAAVTANTSAAGVP